MSAARTERMPRGLWILLLSEAVLTTGLALAFPFLALYFNRQGFSHSLTGAILTSFLLVSSASQIVGGEASDRRGRGAVMASALWVRALFLFVLARCIQRAAPLQVILFVNAAAAFAGGFAGPAVRSWIAERCPPERRLEAFALDRAAVNVGWVVGPAIGGMLALRSYSSAFYFSAATCVASAMLVTLFVRGESRTTRSVAEKAPADRLSLDGRFAGFCAAAFAASVVLAQLVVPMPLYAVQAVGLREDQVGQLLSLNGLGIVLTQHAVSRALTRRRLASAGAGGCLVLALGYGCVAAARNFPQMVAAILIITLGEVVVSPCLQALAVEFAPSRSLGRYLGVSGFAQGAGVAAAPALGGFLLDGLGRRWPAAPWLVTAALAVVTAGVLAALGARLRAGGALTQRERLAVLDAPIH